ncbi:pectin lyase fold/virulence factor [Vibrio phage 1.165.O._10N.261.51.B7]|nr:pectin lyase fold/virulence factor [Vibrio phage 1.165.O._10N.261.51.B7]
MSCSEFPTIQTAKTFKLDAETQHEVVTSDNDRTSPASDGKTKLTLKGFENQVDTLIAEGSQDIQDVIDQGEQDIHDAIENTIGKSYIGAWAQGVTTFTTMNEYSDFNGITYKPKPGVTLPYTAQTADPTTSPDNANVEPFSDVNSANLGGLTPYRANNVSDMVSGITSGGNSVTHVVGQVWGVYSQWRVTSVSNPMTLDDFEPVGSVCVDDFSNLVSGVDWSPAIHAALDASGSVYFRNRQYKVNSGITISKDNAVIGTTLRNFFDVVSTLTGNAPVLDFSDCTDDICISVTGKFVTLQGVAIDGGYNNSTSTKALQVGTTNNASNTYRGLINVSVSGFIAADAVAIEAFAWGIEFLYCYVNGITNGTGFKIPYSTASGGNSTTTTARKLYVNYCDTCVYISQQTEVHFTNLIMERCAIGLIADRQANVHVDHVYFEGVGYDGPSTIHSPSWDSNLISGIVAIDSSRILVNGIWFAKNSTAGGNPESYRLFTVDSIASVHASHVSVADDYGSEISNVRKTTTSTGSLIAIGCIGMSADTMKKCFTSVSDSPAYRSSYAWSDDSNVTLRPGQDRINSTHRNGFRYIPYLDNYELTGAHLSTYISEYRYFIGGVIATTTVSTTTGSQPTTLTLDDVTGLSVGHVLQVTTTNTYGVTTTTASGLIVGVDAASRVVTLAEALVNPVSAGTSASCRSVAMPSNPRLSKQGVTSTSPVVAFENMQLRSIKHSYLVECFGDSGDLLASANASFSFLGGSMVTHDMVNPGTIQIANTTAPSNGDPLAKNVTIAYTGGDCRYVFTHLGSSICQ